jgi:YHS domain-containing protein
MKFAPAIALICIGTSVSLLAARAIAAQGATPPPPQETTSSKDTGAARPERKADAKGDPYPLATCAVCGAKLGAAGKPLAREIDGRDLRFCCSECAGKFESDKAALLAAIDQKIIEQQLAHYPLKTCLVMDENALDQPGNKNYNMVYRNRLLRFCCEGCVKPFQKEPATHLKRLDDAVITQQSEAYPLATCLVSGEKLGSMGAPVDKVYGVSLVRFCCKGCIKTFESDPPTYMSRLHEAWMSKGGAGHEGAHDHGTGKGKHKHDHDDHHDHKHGD